MNKEKKPDRWSGFNIKLTVLKALKKGIISKDEAKLVLDADDPSKYMFLSDRDEDEVFSKTKELMERLELIPPLVFVDENGNIC